MAESHCHSGSRAEHPGALLSLHHKHLWVFFRLLKGIFSRDTVASDRSMALGEAYMFFY